MNPLCTAFLCSIDQPSCAACASWGRMLLVMLSRYERGIHQPPHQFVEAVAKGLGVSAAYSYGADDWFAEIIRIMHRKSPV